MTSENTWDQGKVEEDEQDDLRGYDLKFKWFLFIDFVSYNFAKFTD